MRERIIPGPREGEETVAGAHSLRAPWGRVRGQGCRGAVLQGVRRESEGKVVRGAVLQGGGRERVTANGCGSAVTGCRVGE
jgi:hypothetical protein